MAVMITCPDCGGTGHRLCRKCGGTGKKGFNPWETPVIDRDCDQCLGSGRDPCPDPTCKGTGRIMKEQK
jgi:DnaJ-class molecular chaperone